MGKIVLDITFFILMSVSICFGSSNEDGRRLIKCFANEYTGIDTIVKINGFYKFKVNNYYRLLTLYSNGYIVWDFDIDYYKESKESFFGFYYSGPKWGVYTVKNNIIEAFVFESPRGLSWYRSMEWFMIIDSTTIIKLNGPSEFIDLKKRISEINYDERNNFIMDEDIPDYNKSWVIKRRWFWCDKASYKKWKKEKRRNKY